MHFDIAHSAGKARAQRLHARRQARLERQLRVRLRHFFDDVFAVVADHARHGVFDVEHVVDGRRQALQKIVGANYTVVGQFFLASVETAYAERLAAGRKTGDFSIDNAKENRVINNGGPAIDGRAGSAADGRDFEIKGMAQEFWRAFNNWAHADAFAEVKQINAATKSLLRRILRTAAGEGKNYDGIAEAIRAKAKQLNARRAMRIARTETHRASTYAVDEAVRSTRVRFDREWVSMADDRTRPAFNEKPTAANPWDHRKANGQRRPMGQPFDVSGEKLMFPGDPAGSPGNTINCRCVLIYHPANPVGVWM